MLHWLAGQKPSEGSNDPDATGYVEPPETPAPVFAVRAFKQAIFGTPQTAQPKARRHSNTENGRPKNVESKPARPGMNRPKSSSDAQTLAKPEIYPLGEPLSSPTKGILLSPGTAAARKKNVTFGDGVVDNEEKRPMKSGFPDDCPGGFPSIGNLSSDDEKTRASSPDKGRARSKLTDALEQVREESAKRKAKGAKGTNNADTDDELPGNVAEPKSTSGKYWKHEYDIYRTNTQREVKKLITKQKAAKSFALMKDTQCTDLADQLKQEQKKVEKLEAKTTEYASLIEDLRAQLKASQIAVRAFQHNAETSNVQPERKKVERPSSSHGQTVISSQRRDLKRKAGNGSPPTVAQALELADPYRPSIERRTTLDDPVQRPSEPYNPSALLNAEESDVGKPRGARDMKSKGFRARSTEDIWALSFNTSSAVAAKADESGPNLNDPQAFPFKSLDINTLPNRRNSRRNGSPQSMDVKCKSAPDLERVDSKDIEATEDQTAPSPPLPSTPFHPRTVKESINTAKENIPPEPPKHIYQTELRAKPSAIWGSFNAHPAGKRNPSMTGKDGKEVTSDRIEAARARIAARNRMTAKT